MPVISLPARMTIQTLLIALLTGALVGLSLVAMSGLYKILRNPLRSLWSTMRMRFLRRRSRRNWQLGRKITQAGKASMQNNDNLFLIAGLGNPGRKYSNTRHNIGFMAINRLAERSGLQLNRIEQNAIITRGALTEHKVLLVKPQTFMNESGRAVGALSRYYHIPPERILAICDDLDLPYGKIRLRPGGGSAGHKGIRSITQHLGTQNFPRLRVGIGRPPGQMDPADYVLRRFARDEEELMDLLLVTITECIETFLQEGIEKAMTRFNSRQVL